MKLDWKKALIYPVIIYVVIFMFVSLLIALKVDTNATWVWLLDLALSVGLLYFFATKLDTKDIKIAALYGLVWVVVLAGLDLLITRRFTGMDFFYEWRTWLAYGLTFLVPTATVAFFRNK